MGRKHPFLSFMLIFPNLLPLISSQCTDYKESSQPTNVTLMSSPPVMMDGRLHYCNSHHHCSVTCINRNDNEHGNSPFFHVDDQCLTLFGIRSKSGFSVLEEGIVNTTIRFPCSSVSAIRCVFDDEHFSAMIGITKDKECNNKSAVISTSQTDSPALVPGPLLNASTPSTAPTTSTTSTPTGPTKVDTLEPSVSIPLVVTLVIIALLVGILVAVLVLLSVICRKRIKFSWRKICRVPLPTPARSEEEGSTADDISPIEEEQLPSGVGRRNEEPDGTDEDDDRHLIKAVQATN